MTSKCIILIRKVQKNVKIYCRYFCICSICIIFVSNCRIKIFCMLTERLPFYFVLLNGNSAVGLTKEISDGDFVSTIGLCGFLICLEGEIRISHDGTIYKMKRGDVYLNTSSIILRLLSRSANFRGVILVSKVDFVISLVHKATSPQNILYIRSNPCISLAPDAFDKFKSQVLDLYDSIGSDRFMDNENQTELLLVELMKAKAQCICYELFLLFFGNHPVKPLELSRADEIFHQFMLDLNANYKTERKVEKYAEMQSLTPRYFSKLIRDRSGLSPVQWVDQTIIAEAKQVLESTSMSIKQVALEFGFSNQSFFGKYFRQHTGISPFQYRKRNAR